MKFSLNQNILYGLLFFNFTIFGAHIELINRTQIEDFKITEYGFGVDAISITPIMCGEYPVYSFTILAPYGATFNKHSNVDLVEITSIEIVKAEMGYTVFLNNRQYTIDLGPTVGQNLDDLVKYVSPNPVVAPYDDEYDDYDNTSSQFFANNKPVIFGLTGFVLGILSLKLYQKVNKKLKR